MNYGLEMHKDFLFQVLLKDLMPFLCVSFLGD